MRDADVSVWRGIVLGVLIGAVMWAGLIGLIWWLAK